MRYLLHNNEGLDKFHSWVYYVWQSEIFTIQVAFVWSCSWIIARLIITRRKIPSNFTNKHNTEREMSSSEKSWQPVFSFPSHPTRTSSIREDKLVSLGLGNGSSRFHSPFEIFHFRSRSRITHRWETASWPRIFIRGKFKRAPRQFLSRVDFTSRIQIIRIKGTLTQRFARRLSSHSIYDFSIL